MKFRSITTKLIFAMGISVFLVLAVLITYTSISLRSVMIEDGQKQAMTTAKEYANRVKLKLEEALIAGRTMAQAFSGVKDEDAPLDIGRDPANEILKHVLEENQSFLGTYTLWEPDAFDQMDAAYAGLEGHDETGRYIPYWVRNGDNEIILEPLLGYEEEGIGDYYQVPKRTKREVVIGPYSYPIAGEEVQIMSLVTPILHDGDFYGIAGVDLKLDWIQKLVDDVKLFGGHATVHVVSNNGTLVALTGQPEMMGKSLDVLHGHDSIEDIHATRRGEERIVYDGDMIEIYTPVQIGNTGTPWSVGIMVPSKYLMTRATQTMLKQISIGVFLTILILLAIWALIRKIVRPLAPIAEMAGAVAVGEVDSREIETFNDEIGQVYSSIREVVQSFEQMTTVCEAVAEGDLNSNARVRGENDVLGKSINVMVSRLRGVVSQAKAIAEGDYSSEIKPRSEEDELGKALYRMTSSLREATEENKRQDWVKTGQTELNEKVRGELELDRLLDNVITYLSKYLNAQIGAIYLADDDDNLQLIGTYAFKKRKTLSNEFKIGEGLVGQAALEKKSILLTNVPDDYVSVSSGLGELPPKNILVLPFVYAGRLMGVIEIGTLNEFSGLELEFLDQVAETVAIAVHSARSRAQLQRLFGETQAQSEELQAQQEELRSTNEELEEKTKNLQDSQERLQKQQEELEQTNEELEERTQALEKQKIEVDRKNRDLEEAQGEIEGKAQDLALTSKYKSEFLANMSHELRTPLNSLLILSKLLIDNKEGNLTGKQVEFSRTINSSGTELLKLINDILDLSKIESGKMELLVEDVNLDRFVSDIGEKFVPVAREKGLEFPVKVADDIPDVIRTDPQRLGQVVNNLLSNAFKFTKSGNVSLNIERSESDEFLHGKKVDANRLIAVSVSDTGVGIPVDKQKLIFEAFQQADGTTVRKFGGTGLGLSISRELVNLLGGEIKLDSETGRGSRFTVLLPESVPEQSTDAAEKVTVVPNEEPPPEPQPAIEVVPGQKPDEIDSVESIPDDRRDMEPGERSILVIEDDPEFAEILAGQSRGKGFKCLIASDGESGLHLADYYQPSAILLDIGLPRMNGMSVMNRLKENLQTRHIPVHIISGQDEIPDHKKLGALGFVRKPVNLTQLDEVFGKIETLLSQPVMNLLIVEDDEVGLTSMTELLGMDDVNIITASTAAAAMDQLKKQRCDCIVLDLNLPDMPGIKFLEEVRNNEKLAQIPVIIFTGKELTKEEEILLDKYAERVIKKGEKSPERLLDETALFLHRVEKNLPDEKRRMIKMLHDKEQIFNDKKILVVDDDMRNVFALSSVLEEKGMRLSVAKNGREGVEGLQNDPDIDLVLMDIMMPEMDGYEAMRKIREENRFKELPIIALTAKAMKGDRHKCIEAGANDYLSKPVDSDKLMSMLRVWLYQ
jgi:CheY-like chemotaxis protein/signal transduction histidine kinase/HAMP domain-containing protein